MPTVYTAPNLKGAKLSFAQFAKNCARAFGVTMNMWDEPWKPVVPSSYHADALKKAKNDVQKYRSMSDRKLLSLKKKELQANLDYHAKYKKKTQANLDRLSPILEQVKAWQPPTPDHQSFKTFMTNQLAQTIDFGANMSNMGEKPISVKAGMKNWTAKEIRKDLLRQARKAIKYHSIAYEKEVAGCAARNKWVTELQASFSEENK